MIIERHVLDFHKTAGYFIDNLQKTNKLSDSIISVVPFEEGEFYTFLPENSSAEGLYDFKFGGKMSCIRDEMSVFIHNFLKVREGFVCIFDDFNASIVDVQEDDVYKSFGFCYKNEVCYVLNENVPVEMVYKCLTYSSAIWHSLSVITKTQPEIFENKELDEGSFVKICQETVLVMLSAYDGEGYVFWEKC